MKCPACGDEWDTARTCCSKVLARQRENIAELRASLASLVACIDVATHRGWHHSQVEGVQTAADFARIKLETRGSTIPALTKNIQ